MGRPEPPSFVFIADTNHRASRPPLPTPVVNDTGQDQTTRSRFVLTPSAEEAATSWTSC
jgi:hypothetical protein